MYLSMYVPNGLQNYCMKLDALWHKIVLFFVLRPTLKTGTNTNLETADSEKRRHFNWRIQFSFHHRGCRLIPWLGPSKTKIQDIVITADGIEKLLADLKPHKASGPDRLPNRVLGKLSKELALTFATLYTQSLNSDELPKYWSNALITPVYKKGNVHTFSNYRPVSFTSVGEVRVTEKRGDGRLRYIWKLYPLKMLDCGRAQLANCTSVAFPVALSRSF